MPTDPSAPRAVFVEAARVHDDGSTAAELLAAANERLQATRGGGASGEP